MTGILVSIYFPSVMRGVSPVISEGKLDMDRIYVFFPSLVFFVVEGDEKACNPSQSYNVTWYLRYCDCYNEIFSFGVRTV